MFILYPRSFLPNPPPCTNIPIRYHTKQYEGEPPGLDLSPLKGIPIRELSICPGYDLSSAETLRDVNPIMYNGIPIGPTDIEKWIKAEVKRAAEGNKK